MEVCNALSMTRIEIQVEEVEAALAVHKSLRKDACFQLESYLLAVYATGRRRFGGGNF